MSAEDPARKFFDRKMTDRERAIFEGAVGLASIYHQFIGTPVSRDKDVIEALEEAIRRSTLLQPYKKDVKVKLSITGDYRKKDVYNYHSLEGRDLDITIVTEYGSSRVTSRMRYMPELKYVLMYVEKVEDTG
ncbi:MAG: dihydroneopterin aldolase family protein [Nitrososphaerales archaeon]